MNKSNKVKTTKDWVKTKGNDSTKRQLKNFCAKLLPERNVTQEVRIIL